jgi:hypothetical protein
MLFIVVKAILVKHCKEIFNWFMNMVLWEYVVFNGGGKRWKVLMFDIIHYCFHWTVMAGQKNNWAEWLLSQQLKGLLGWWINAGNDGFPGILINHMSSGVRSHLVFWIKSVSCIWITHCWMFVGRGPCYKSFSWRKTNQHFITNAVLVILSINLHFIVTYKMIDINLWAFISKQGVIEYSEFFSILI